MKKCEHRLTTSVCYVCASPKYGKSQKISMNRDDIIAMAREAGGGLSCIAEPLEHPWKFSESELIRFAALVATAERNRTWTQAHWTEYERSIVAAEREACAELIEEMKVQHPKYIAAAIRSRGE